jgi:hypothetical protein
MIGFRGYKWFQWAVFVGFGLVVGLLLVIVMMVHGKSANAGGEVRAMQAKVAKLVLLPTNETPALATVTDPSKLTSNGLLSQAKQGDKILIYAQWKQAVIYRPSVDKVVVIGPVDVAPPNGNTRGFNSLK